MARPPDAFAPARPAPPAGPPPLSALETEVIGFFVHLCQLLGLPKSTAEIYGLLFATPRPLAMDELIGRLRLSKGSASQGLKFLRNLGAVQRVYVPGDRRDRYVAETELRKLLGGFLKEKLGTQLDGERERLARMERLVAHLPEADRPWLVQRIRKLRLWQKRGRQLMPVVIRVLG
jgi:DNA-binding transcriptional regulator GbsR (MarR family)